MFCWHMNDSLDQLKRAALLFNFVAIGSCAEYDVQANKAGYLARLREASAMLDYVETFYGRRPWIHLMRANGVLKDAIRFESSDSTNVARNHSRTKGQPWHVGVMAGRVEAPIYQAARSAPRGRPAAETSNFDDPDPELEAAWRARLEAA
jgi:hypothetical protein